MTNEKTTPETAQRAMQNGRAFLQANDPVQALKSFQSAADSYAQLGDVEQQTRGLNIVAGLLLRQGRADEAQAVFATIADVLAEEPESSMRAAALSNRGLILVRQDQFAEAMACFEEALAQYQQIGEPVRIAEQWANIGTTYRDLEQPDRAIDSYQRAYAIFREHSHEEGLGDQLTNIAYALVMRGDTMDGVRKYREALSYYESAGADSKVDSTKQNIEKLEAALMCSRDGTARPCNC